MPEKKDLARSAPLLTRVRSAVEMGIHGSIDRVLDNSLVPLQAPILHLFLDCPFQLLPSFAPGVTDGDPSDLLDRSSVVHLTSAAFRGAASVDRSHGASRCDFCWRYY
jgi:hypothetical protein